MAKEQKIIDQEGVEKIEGLVKINLSDQEREKVAGQLDSVLGSVEVLGEIEMGNLNKDVNYIEAEGYLRQDEAIQSSDQTREGIRENFSDRDGDYLRVKTVIKK